ncbi:MAG TPA: hypothetical protein VHB25_17440 [Gemmatimonadaceae bacterium]|nr:hypothetical protein [Gemmatimonadaceae bacterium]
MRAMIGVLDEDLSTLATQLAAPIPPRTLTEAEWQDAEHARVAVEQDLRGLEAEAAVIAMQAADWRAKADLAAQRGDTALADQAHVRAAEAEQTRHSYAEEIGAIRGFLREWAARITRADPGRASDPPTNEPMR